MSFDNRIAPNLYAGRARLYSGRWLADHAEVTNAIARGHFTWPWRMRIERVNGPMTVVTGTRTNELDRGSATLLVNTVYDISFTAADGAHFDYTLCGAPGLEGFP